MIDKLCCELPYYICIGSLVHAMIFTRSKSLKYVPSCRSFFFRFFICCIISIVAKYPFNGTRPESKEYILPNGWKKVLNLSPVGGFTRILIMPISINSSLVSQPAMEIYNIPLSFSQLKNRYLPRSGTPSSHSIIAGYLSGKIIKMGYSRSIGLIPMIIPVTRIVYRHHYIYQVVLGVAIGYTLNKSRCL